MLTQQNIQHNAVNLVVYAVIGNYTHVRARLTIAVNTSITLFVPSWIPGKVIMQDCIKMFLQVDAFAKAISGNQNMFFGLLDRAIVSKVMAYLSSPAGPSITINLSDREMEVLTLAAKGQTNRAIAQQLASSDCTVQGHIARIFEKMQANSRTEAVMKAVSMGLIPPDIAHEEED